MANRHRRLRKKSVISTSRDSCERLNSVIPIGSVQRLPLSARVRLNAVGGCGLQPQRSPLTLRVRNPRKRQVFGKRVMPIDCPIQKRQLPGKLGMAMLRQGQGEILQHRAHPPHDLDASRATMADFDAGEVHKVLPVRRPENEPQPAGGIADLFAAELPQADTPKQALKLIDGEHGRCRVIDGR
jgi:hypothetical protein